MAEKAPKAVTSTRRKKPKEEPHPELPGAVDPTQNLPEAKPRKKGKRVLRQEAHARKIAQRERDKAHGIIEINVRVPQEGAQKIRDMARKLRDEKFRGAGLPIEDETESDKS